MKKSIKIFGVGLLTVALASCGGGSSVKKDAQRLADLQCQAKGLMKKAMTGDTSVMSESQALMKKTEALSAELQKKYTSATDQAEFLKYFKADTANCK